MSQKIELVSLLTIIPNELPVLEIIVQRQTATEIHVPLSNDATQTDVTDDTFKFLNFYFIVFVVRNICAVIIKFAVMIHLCSFVYL